MFCVLTCWSAIVQIWVPMCIELLLEWVLANHRRDDRIFLNPYTFLFIGNCASVILSSYLPEILGRPMSKTLEDVIVLSEKKHCSNEQYYPTCPRVIKVHKQIKIQKEGSPESGHKGLRRRKRRNNTGRSKTCTHNSCSHRDLILCTMTEMTVLTQRPNRIQK